MQKCKNKCRKYVFGHHPNLTLLKKWSLREFVITFSVYFFQQPKMSKSNLVIKPSIMARLKMAWGDSSSPRRAGLDLVLDGPSNDKND